MALNSKDMESRYTLKVLDLLKGQGFPKPKSKEDPEAALYEEDMEEDEMELPAMPRAKKASGGPAPFSPPAP